MTRDGLLPPGMARRTFESDLFSGKPESEVPMQLSLALALSFGMPLLLTSPLTITPAIQVTGIRDTLGADPSPHQKRAIRVAPKVELEVLDWGGSGPTLVFLAGFGNSAHVFDAFAPEFIPHFRVLGITRRGFGASSKPTAEYDTTTLVRDVMAVLDSLGIRRASFAAHSLAVASSTIWQRGFPSA